VKSNQPERERESRSEPEDATSPVRDTSSTRARQGAGSERLTGVQNLWCLLISRFSRPSNLIICKLERESGHAWEKISMRRRLSYSGTGVLKATGYSGFITLHAPRSPSRLLRCCCCSLHAPKVKKVAWLVGFIFLPELSWLYFF